MVDSRLCVLFTCRGNPRTAYVCLAYAAESPLSFQPSCEVREGDAVLLLYVSFTVISFTRGTCFFGGSVFSPHLAVGGGIFVPTQLGNAVMAEPVCSMRKLRVACRSSFTGAGFISFFGVAAGA